MSNPTQPTGPLSVGNVVSAGLRIYRDRFKTLFGISIKATLWSLAPFVALLIPVVLAFILRENFSGIVLFLFTLVWLVFVVYCSAKSFTNLALISRLVFGILTDKPETAESAMSEIGPRMWKFWRAQVYLGIILFFVNLGISILQSIVMSVIGSVINSSAILIPISLIVNLIGFVIYIWFVSRYFIPELPLAMENNVSAGEALSRSWDLSKGFVVRIQLIVLVAFLVTIPVYLLAGIPVFLSMGSIIAGLSTDPSLLLGYLPQLMSRIILTVLIFLLLNVAAIPFWQSIKAVIYYDLRSRREGLGLQLQDRKS